MTKRSKKKGSDTIIAYARVSTQSQACKGFSLQQQEKLLKEAGKSFGFKKVLVYEEIASGKFSDPIKRPTLWKAIKRAKELNCPILVTAFDRFSRNSGSLENLIRDEEISVISSTEGEIDPLIVSHKVLKAAAERELISSRTRDKLAELKNQGILLGNRTNLNEVQKRGHRTTKNQADKFALSMIEKIRELRCKGLGFKRIAETFNSEDIPTRRGGKWHSTTVKKIMERALELEKAEIERLSKDNYGSW